MDNSGSYTYDSANQLIREEKAGAYRHSWTYDNAGNILTRTEETWENDAWGQSVTVNYTYGDENWGDLLTAYNGQEIKYDQIGNPESIDGWSFTWQHGRQLASMAKSGVTWSFTYNADGLRTKRTNGTTTYSYVYNGSQLMQMTKGSDTLDIIYDAAGRPTALTHNGATYYYITNIQGDIVGIVDTEGETVATYTYDAWGNILSISGTEADTIGNLNPLRYRGYVYDTETGLYYLQSRYYNAVIGRFINSDIFFSTGQTFQGNNMFVYCLNNPICMVDYEGCDAIYVVDYKENRGLPIVGHAIVFLQNSDGVWYKTQYSGVFPDKSTATIELCIADMSEVEMMINNETIEDVEYIHISGDFSASLTYAEENCGTNYSGYNVLQNSCFHYARNTLLKGSFEYDQEKAALTRYTGNVPSGLYDYLRISRKQAKIFNPVKGFIENVLEKICSWF